MKYSLQTVTLLVATMALVGSISRGSWAQAATQSAVPAPVSGPTEASSEPEPSTGLALTVSGGVLMGVGALNLATYPVCDVKSLYPNQDRRDLCKTLSLVAGVGFTAVGIPLLIVGLVQRSNHKDWKAAHQSVATWVPRAEFRAPNADLGGLSLVSRF
ncbi:MAG TPA: hypothetical protein VIV60_29700 [Polyangiaceae bacterium]